MRKYFFLVTEHEDDEKVGCVHVYDSPKQRPLKGDEDTITVLDDDKEGFRDVGKQVKLGYADFEDEDDFEGGASEVMQSKIREVDREWAVKAGVEEIAYDTEEATA